MADRGTGWELDKRLHFDDIVMKYDAVRPEYPRELFSDIFSYVRDSKDKKALEIGAGTGKATIPFLNAGYDVTAVEVGANMAGFLRERFKEFDGFNVVVSPFEEAVLDEGIYDLIYAATAFHWVDAEIGCPKVFRLLKQDGVCALFRYNVIPDEGDLFEEMQEEYRKYFYKPYKRPVTIAREDLGKPSEILRGFGFEDLTKYGFTDTSMTFYDRERVFDADEYIDSLDTMSDHRALPEDDRTALYAGVKKAIKRNGGRYKVNYIYQLYMGRRGK